MSSLLIILFSLILPIDILDTDEDTAWWLDEIETAQKEK